MNANKSLNQLLLFYEAERKQTRAYQLEKIIPHQESLIKDCVRLGLPSLADENILRGMKREYRAVTGKDYQ